MKIEKISAINFSKIGTANVWNQDSFAVKQVEESANRVREEYQNTSKKLLNSFGIGVKINVQV